MARNNKQRPMTLLTIRMSETSLRVLHQLARSNGMEFSSYVRDVLLMPFVHDEAMRRQAEKGTR